MCENAMEFIEKYVNDILDEKFEMAKTYDLWEEHEGTSFYSFAAIFGAYSNMLKIYEVVESEYSNNRLKIEGIEKRKKIFEKRIRQIKEYSLKTFYDDSKKSFVRNTEDRRIDISMLGAVVPFGMISHKEKKFLTTIERMNMTLRTYTGGYIRYEGDTYNGGYNPWVIANLWMANYYIESGEKKKAKECFEFVVKTASPYGLLGEQVNNETMQPSWIIGLTWSHAMFVIVLNKLNELGMI
jgi:GH15 family glucan-1,4-alpha-glucosidase